jgi:hypothetical protein
VGFYCLEIHHASCDNSGSISSYQYVGRPASLYP